jgi:Flp pilus assembly pilin Flp
MSEIKSPGSACEYWGESPERPVGLCPALEGYFTREYFQEAVTMHHLWRLWREDEGQDIAEYAVMLAVILVIVVGTIRLIGSNANNVFSNVASSISQ